MPISSSSLFLFLLFSAPHFLSSTPISTHGRRALHQPFFPLPSSSPPPSEPPDITPQFPKYPSSTNPQPFFPFYRSPPSPPSSSQPTFPANISSLIFPNSHSAPPRSSNPKLVLSVLLPLLSLLLLAAALSLLFLLRRRRRRSLRLTADKSDARRLFPASAAPSDARKPPPSAQSSEFLYVGTLASEREDFDGPRGESPAAERRSPELWPLPPLARQQFRRDANCSSDEEFYSPSGSAGRLSSSWRTFQAAVAKCGSVASSPSYPSLSGSASSPVPVSSPARSGGKSPSTASDGDTVAVPPPPPPPPALLMRPLTPSPPKWTPHSPSPPSLPAENKNNSSRDLDFSGGKLLSPARNVDLPFADNPPTRQAPPLPPPPPPPPPAGYWESQIRGPASQLPPALTPPRPAGFKNSTVTVLAHESPLEKSSAVEKSDETPRLKLKPLHWDKVRASSDRVMVWDQLRSSSFQVNEEMIETLFVCNATNMVPKEANKRQVLPSPNQENRVLDPKKSQNIAILLRALNVTKEEVCEALLDGNTDSLGAELLETLLKMAPSKEEEIKLREQRDDSPFKLGPAEKFLKAVVDIPFAFKRVDAMLYIAIFDSEVDYLNKSFATLEAACEELRTSRLFLKLLEAVLKTGNRMNVGTNRGDALAFKLDTLLKLADVKGTDGKTTLLHFVVQEIIKAEGLRLSASNPSRAKTQANTLQDDMEHKKLGLQVVSGLGSELSNVKKAAAMDSDVLSSYVSKLAGGFEKISDVLRLNDAHNQERGQRFHEAMERFSKRAEDGIIKVQAQESVALSLVKEITEYFHGNSAREEAHPFRIFMVVRDFLTILDQVCKEVGRINERTFAISGRQFPVPVNPTLSPVFPRLRALRPESSDDESSSSP